MRSWEKSGKSVLQATKNHQAKEKSAWELIKLHFSGGNEIIVRRSDWTRVHIKMLMPMGERLEIVC
jgi:hypothetical protein